MEFFFLIIIFTVQIKFINRKTNNYVFVLNIKMVYCSRIQIARFQSIVQRCHVNYYTSQARERSRIDYSSWSHTPLTPSYRDPFPGEKVTFLYTIIVKALTKINLQFFFKNVDKYYF